MCSNALSETKSNVMHRACISAIMERIDRALLQIVFVTIILLSQETSGFMRSGRQYFPGMLEEYNSKNSLKVNMVKSKLGSHKVHINAPASILDKIHSMIHEKVANEKNDISTSKSKRQYIFDDKKKDAGSSGSYNRLIAENRLMENDQGRVNRNLENEVEKIIAGKRNTEKEVIRV